MITAQDARNNTYDKTVSWCEKHIEPDIEQAIGREEKVVNRLFWECEANPEEVKRVLEEHGFKVQIQDVEKVYGIKSEHGVMYNLVISW